MNSTKTQATRATWLGRPSTSTVVHFDKSRDGRRVVFLVFDDKPHDIEISVIEGNFFRGAKPGRKFFEKTLKGLDWNDEFFANMATTLAKTYFPK